MADAAAVARAVVSARTRVHRGHQHHARGIRNGDACAHEVNAVVLERLAERLECRPPELRQLVEEQHAVVRERHLTRARRIPAAHQSRIGHGVVRCAERAALDQTGTRTKTAGDRVDLRRFERFRRRHGRQNARQPPREHRLARAGRTDQQHVVRPGRRDLQRASRVLLPPDVREVRPGRLGQDHTSRRFRSRQLENAALRIHHLAEHACRTHLEPGHDRGFTRIRGWNHDRADPLFRAPQRHGQHAAHRAELAVEPELAEVAHGLVDAVELPARNQNRERNGQVERTSLFPRVRRREIDRDAFGRHEEAGVVECGRHAFATLAHGALGQPDDRDHGQPGRDVRLDAYEEGLDAQHRAAHHLRQHPSPGGVRCAFKGWMEIGAKEWREGTDVRIVVARRGSRSCRGYRGREDA